MKYQRFFTILAAVAVVASTFLLSAEASAADYTETHVDVKNIWIDRDVTNGTDSEGRLFIRFGTKVCDTPSGTNETLAGLDIRDGTRNVAKMIQTLAVSASLAGRQVTVHTANGDSNVGCHIRRLSLYYYQAQ